MDETVTTSLGVASADIRLLAEAGARHAGAHAAYGAGSVRLAFGRHALSDRIMPVGEVERGRACGCHCPACSEELIARQGEALAWHFAHVSGAQCRDAVAAATAAWCAQLLRDGRLFHLPAIAFPWGASSVMVDSSPRPLAAISARTEQDAPGAPFAVIATMETSQGPVSWRIYPVSVGQAVLPSAEDCAAAGLPTCVVDLAPFWKAASEANPQEPPSPEALGDALLRTAPRRWVWSPRVEKAREAHCKARLGPVLQALSAPLARPRDTHEIRARLRAWGLADALDALPGVGEGLSMPVADAQALFVHDMVGAPLAREPRRTPMAAAGFSNQEIVAWIRARRLDRLPFGAAKSWTSDDRIELARLHPHCAPVYEQVQAWVAALWRAGYLVAKPWKATLKAKQPGAFDQAMAPHGAPFWRPSDEAAKAVRAAR